MTSTSFPQPSLPKSAITLPNKPFLTSALNYTKQHTTPTTVNHCLRSASFALIVINKAPHLAKADKDLVVLACILHDLGWATTKALLSKDKRFEVDGANLGRDWMRENFKSDEGVKWSEREEQLLWDAIALHTTPSIGLHKEAEVAAVGMGIAADFLGHKFPGGLFTLEEQKEIVAAFPRLGFHDTVVDVMCGLCREKPETTYDNFVAEFGVIYGLDGKGERKEEYKKQVEAHSMNSMLMGALKANEAEEERG